MVYILFLLLQLSLTSWQGFTMQIFVVALIYFQILIWYLPILIWYFPILISYLPIRTEICRITISITMLVVLQGISIIYLPLQPKLEIIRNIFRSGFDLSLGQTESISGRGKLQMDRKCQNPHCTVLHIPPYSKGPLNPLTKHGWNASHLEWILIAWSPNLCKVKCWGAQGKISIWWRRGG